MLLFGNQITWSLQDSVVVQFDYDNQKSAPLTAETRAAIEGLTLVVTKGESRRSVDRRYYST